MEDKKALVIFSGGQDSTTCLAWAKQRYKEVAAISFIYGQVHEIEIVQATLIAETLGVPLDVWDISFYQEMVTSALTGNLPDMNAQHRDNNLLPASFVPNRNALFILLAHSFAQQIKAQVLVTGICQTDYSGYPDCRDEFAKAFIAALNSGADQHIELKTPLMYKTKAETFQMAEEAGILDLVVRESHSCYNGDPNLNKWGRGCGHCPACKIRVRGFAEFLALKQGK